MSRNHQWKPKSWKQDKAFVKQINNLLKIEENNAAKRNIGITCDISASVASIMEHSAKRYEELADDIAYYDSVNKRQ